MPRALAAVLVAALPVSGCTPPPTHGDEYTLTVQFKTPMNPQFTVEASIVVNKPFEITKTNGTVTNTIAGTLKPPSNGKYPLDLAISEWASETSNIRGTTQLELELGKPWSGGPVSSFVYLRTVTLTRR